VAIHLAVAGTLLAIVSLATRNWLLPTVADKEGSASPRLVRPGPLVLLLGVLTMLGAFVEDTPASWSAVYLREDLGVSAGAAGAAYAAATVSLTVGRLLADRLLARIDTARLARMGMATAAAGLGGALIIGTVPATVIGFGLVGLGVSPIFPATLGMAGSLEGYPSGSAISVVSLVARFGFLFGPVTIGAAAEVVGLRSALWLTVLVAVVGLALCGTLRDPARAG
jgi:MFS family permease